MTLQPLRDPIGIIAAGELPAFFARFAYHVISNRLEMHVEIDSKGFHQAYTDWNQKMSTLFPPSQKQSPRDLSLVLQSFAETMCEAQCVGCEATGVADPVHQRLAHDYATEYTTLDVTAFLHNAIRNQLRGSANTVIGSVLATMNGPELEAVLVQVKQDPNVATRFAALLGLSDFPS